VKLPLDEPVRIRVRTDFATTLVLEAGAGTGKTTVLVERLVNLVVTGTATLDRVVAITFTEAAAGELKMRLRDALEAHLETAPVDEAQRLARAIIDLERANVSTIHAFASALLRERPFEAGIDPSFSVVADVAGRRTFDDAWNAWIEETLTAGDDVLMRAVHLGLQIGDFQRAARNVVAERDVLGLPVAPGLFEPNGLLAELETALGSLKKQKKYCRDESDGAYQMIEELEERVREGKRLKGTALEAFLRRVKITAHKGSQANWETKTVCVDVKAALKRLKETAEAWVERSDADVNHALRGRLSGLLQTYEAQKSESALADFQDLLLRARDVLVVSVPVRRYFQAKFDRILVDEFQDTDPLQAELVAFLAEDPSTPAAADWRQVHLLPGKLFIVGDPKQSIYRFRRADLQVYEAVKALVLRCGGAVLPLTTNFRTVPSVIGFVNERFKEIFAQPGDPAAIDLEPFRDEADPKSARTIALTVPPEQMPDDKRLEARRAVVAETIAAFIDDITRVKPWAVYDPNLKKTRPARAGDVAILVRKMTPEFIAPFEDRLRARQVNYHLVGGKEYFARDEVRALAAVLRAIDNPADRLSLVQALRSPFFAISDADLLHFVSTKGVLNINAPQGEDVAKRDVFDPVFKVLARLHRLRRIESPSVVIEELFARTRALPSFLMKPSGAQMVANLWKVLETARAYEAAAPATLRAFVRFLQDEEASSQAEGDSPVGESIGASVEIVTVHKAKGLEYPIVIVVDLFTDKLPAGDCIIDHAARRGWLKIGKFLPDGWKERSEAEALQQEAEGRRLLYVALTRARDHLVIPCLPGEQVKSWLGPVANTLVRPFEEIPFGKREKNVTWFDSRRLAFGVQGPTTPSVSIAVDGTASDAQVALAAEEVWLAARRTVRKQAHVAAELIVTPSRVYAASELDESGTTGAQRLYGSEPEGELAELSQAAAVAPADEEPAVFGRYVHEILATVDLSGANIEPVARTLARRFGVTDANAARATQMVESVLRLPIMEDARAATKIFREAPLAGNWAAGEAQGKADLVFEHAGEWRVVDFKTDRIDSADAQREHAAQMAAYTRSLTNLVGAQSRGTICFVRRAQVLEI
jgi:ATP-dependent exoDNAse (exonuclease V) beta subunit